MSSFFLAMAAPQPQGFDPEIAFSLLSAAGWIVLHAILPLIGGVLYATHWRTLLAWVTALAAASFTLHAGHQISVSWYHEYFFIERLLLELAAFILAPAFGATAIGIFIRKMWDRLFNNNAMAGVQE